MKLIDLHPIFLDNSSTTKRIGIGIMMDCPSGVCDEDHLLYIPFANPLDGGDPIESCGWQRTGDTFETLTLNPSILRFEKCKWHGWIRNGEVITAS